MSKNERTHGDQMATMGELHGLYKIKIVINEFYFIYKKAYRIKKANV